MQNETLTFEYAIMRNKDKKFYRGSVYGDDRDWTLEKREGFDGAFRYTKNGAHKQIATFPVFFKDCKEIYIA